MKSNDKFTLIGVLAIMLGLPFGFIAEYLADTNELPAWVSVLNASILIIIFCGAIIAFWRSTEFDELQRLIELRAMAIAFMITFAVIMISWSLQINGLMQTELNVNDMFMIAAFALMTGRFIASWKFRVIENEKESAPDAN